MADRRPRAPTQAAPAALPPDLASLADGAADREWVRRGLLRFWEAAGSEVRSALRADRSLAEALLLLVENSQFLAEFLIHSPELLLWLEQARRMQPGRAPEQWGAALGEFAADVAPELRKQALVRFQKRELLRIALRDLQGQAALAETTEELSFLADALLDQAHAWAWNQLAARWGTPRELTGAAAELAVIGLGKLGGAELNYSSDIDLLFLYSGDGETAGGRETTSNREFFSLLAQSITGYVSSPTAQGRAYRVDLRLRPGGREGEVAVPLQAALDYYRGPAREWECQMLIRARSCAGSHRLARQFLAGIELVVYPAFADREALAEAVRLNRQRIGVHLGRNRALGRHGTSLDVKLDPGGIRDVEFLIQYLQRLHGGSDAWVRHRNTRIAMLRLHDKGWLDAGAFHQLSSTYALLRHLEHRLQLWMGQQTHSLPANAERRAALARSLRAAEGVRLPGGEMEFELRRVMAAVDRLGEAQLHPKPAADALPARTLPPPAPPPLVDLSRHGRQQWQRLQRSAANAPETQALWQNLPPAAWPRLRLALEQSDWMAEALIRNPHLLAELAPGAAEVSVAGGAARDLEAGMARLRLFRQRQSLRWLIEEWESARPIEASLSGLSRLAEQILVAAVGVAEQTAGAVPSFCVLALGRLGLGEMDLLSDLDLVFVASEGETEAGTRLAAQLITVLSAYTRHGGLYAVDARLRPAGGEGELVQTPAALRAYFEHRAGAWEAMSYLKLRPVAGNAELAAEVVQSIHAICRQRFRQPADWRGELAGLRDRIEREGHAGNWGLKTVAGGYYDVEFILGEALLRAGQRLEGVAGLAGWARALAGTLLPRELGEELAGQVSFLRAADHALRVGTGKAGSAIPAAGAGIDRAQAWLQRIWPAARGEDLATALAAARARIRAIYARF